MKFNQNCGVEFSQKLIENSSTIWTNWFFVKREEIWNSPIANRENYQLQLWWNYALHIYIGGECMYVVTNKCEKSEGKKESNSIRNILPATVKLRHSNMPYTQPNTTPCVSK